MRFDFFRRSESGNETTDPAPPVESAPVSNAAPEAMAISDATASTAVPYAEQGHIVHAMLLDSRKRAVGYRLAWRPIGGSVGQGGPAGFKRMAKAISQHLKSLKQAGLVAERPQGRNVFYRAQPEGLAPLSDWLSHYEAFWRERLNNLRNLLEEIDP